MCRRLAAHHFSLDELPEAHRRCQSRGARRYHTRIKSGNVRRKQTLKVIKRREEVQELIKLGKMEPRTTRGPRRR